MVLRLPMLLSIALLSGSHLLSAFTPEDVAQQAYVKAFNTASGDEFGTAVAISGDTMVVGAPLEDGGGTDSGAAYIYVRSDGAWAQQAYLKAANAGAGDRFGYSVAISGDTLVVGAHGEDSLSSGVGGDGGNDGALNSGAAYVFTRSNGVWGQQAYLKASNSGAGDAFGLAVAVHADTVAVGAWAEDGPADAATSAGAVYVFTRSGAAWSEQAYLRAANAAAGDQFGFALALDGDALLVGAPQEDSAANSVGGDASSNGSPGSGAAYVFARSAGTWSQHAYLKASNSAGGHQFGFSVSLSGDLAAVGANLESADASGAAYLFRAAAGTWAQEAYLKASNAGSGDHFGQSLAVSGDVLVVGALHEDSNAKGVHGQQTNNIATDSGAAYILQRSAGTWIQQAYVKADNSGSGDQFGRSVALYGRTAVCGANAEASAASGLDGDGTDNSAPTSGAAYVFTGAGPRLPEPELDVTSQGEELADEGSQVDFGLAAVGASVVRAFTIHNRGTADLEISDITVSGGESADYTVDLTGISSTVAADASTTFLVSFSPPSPGRANTTLVINNDDSDEAPFQIALTGAALPEIGVSGNGENLADGDSRPSLADHTDFGLVSVDGGTLTRSFQITNTGTTDLVLGVVTISGEAGADFEVTSAPATTVVPGGSTDLGVTFDPSGIGLRQAELSFTTNDSNETPFNFWVQGTGSGPGLIDPAFGIDGRVRTSPGSGDGGNARARSLALQEDGRIVVAGYADNGLDTDFAVVRYLTGGGLDSSFGDGGVVTTAIGAGFDEATGVAVQGDGKIVVCGFADNGQNDDFALVRYLSDGTLDTGFGSGGKVISALGGSDDRAYALTLQRDGKIVAVGSSQTGSAASVAVVRYLGDGRLDPGFGDGGKLTTPVGVGDAIGYSVALQRDGGIVVAGKASNGIRDDVLVLRYRSDGSMDAGFGSGGSVVTATGISDSAAYSVAVRSNGQIVAGGYTTNDTDTDWLVLRYLADGSPDPSFGSGGNVTTAVGTRHEELNSLIVQADGGVLAAGFARNGSTDDIAVVRYLSSGALDPGFGAGGKVITPVGTRADYGFSLAVQADGYPVVAGYTDNGNNDDFALVRYVANPVVLPADIAVEQSAGVRVSGGSTLDFGEVLVGESSSVATIHIVNDGTDPLTIAGVTKIGAAEGDYTVDTSSMATSLGAGAETSFAVSFAPSLVGARDITLQIDSNDADEPALVLLLTGSGVSTAAEVSVLGNSHEIASGDSLPELADHTQFGSIAVGGSITRTFVIANLGTAPLQLAGPAPGYVEITGGGGGFAVSRQPAAATVAPGETVEFEVKFTPASSGLRQAAVQLASNDADERLYTFTIEATGIGVPRISVASGAGLALTGGSSTVDFGTVTAGSGIAPQTFTITNVGTGDLAVPSVTTTGGDVGNFALSTTGTLTQLAPGASTSFTIAFFTSTPGPRSTSLTIGSSDPAANPFTIGLTGTGVVGRPGISLSGSGLLIVDGDSEASAGDGTDFGAVPLEGSVTRTFTITNTGSADLHLTGAVPDYVNVSGGGFAVSRPPSAAAIAPGKSKSFDLTFRPSSPGPHAGIVTIPSDDTDHSPFTFHIAGVGVGSPELDIDFQGEALADDGSVLDFGLTSVSAAPLVRDLSLANNGSAPLVISGAAVTGSHATDFTLSAATLPTTLAPGAVANLRVSFAALAPGVRLASLVITSNDADESPYQIDLTGAVLPRLSVSGNGKKIQRGDTTPSLADHTDFGSAALPDGQTTRSFIIANGGTADLVLGAVEITGSDAADFTVTSPPLSPVAAGTFSTLQITFTPTVLGARQATVGFTSNDSPRSPFTFAVQGLGTGPGLPDPTFGSDGRVLTATSGGGDERAFGLAVQPDGRVVVAGSVQSGPSTRFALFRYLSNGALDPSFGSGGVLISPVGSGFSQANSVALLPDGRIVAAGLAFNGSNDDFAIIRCLADGSPDPSFGGGSGTVLLPLGNSDDRAYGVALQADGKLVASGSSHDGSRTQFAVVRLLASGEPDPAFGTAGIVRTAVGTGSAWSYSMALQADGKIIAAGEADSGVTSSMAMVRYLGDGSVDSSFGTAGHVLTANGISDSAAYSVAVRRDGRILLGGYATNPTDTDWALVRYFSDGTLDPGFGTGGRVQFTVGSSYEEINSLTVQRDGGIFAAGFARNAASDDFAIARFLADGTPDPAFGSGGKAITPVGSRHDYGFALGVQPDGKVVVAGHSFNGNDYDIALVRYEAKLVAPPEILLQRADTTNLTSEQDTILFDPAFNNGTTGSVTLDIINAGNSDLHITSILTSGAYAADFSVDTTGTQLLVAPGGRTSFAVRFTSSTNALPSAVLQISNDDPLYNPFTLALLAVVIDRDAPVLVGLPRPVVVVAGAGESAAVATWTPPTARDDIALPPPVVVQTAGGAPGSAFPIGTHTISYQAIDAAGNASLVGSFTVQVIRTRPSPAGPGDVDLSPAGAGDGTPVIRGGGNVPGGPLGTTFYTLNHALINNAGEILVEATLTGGSAAEDVGLWSDGGGNTLGLVALEGGAAAGTLFAGTTFASFANLTFNDLGVVASTNTVKDGGTTTANDTGQFSELEASGSYTGALREGSPAPGAGTATFSILHPPALSDSSLAIPGVLKLDAGSGVTAGNDRGVWLKDNSGPASLLFREGGPVVTTSGLPVLGTATYGQPESRIVANSSGDVAFASLVAGNGVASRLLIAGTPGALAAIAARNQFVGNVAIDRFDAESINEAGDVAFRATLTAATAPASANSALFTSIGGALTMIAREDQLAPGQADGVRFDSFKDLHILDGGDVVFLAVLRGTDVDSMSDGAIYRYSAIDASLAPVVREGDLAVSTDSSAILLIEDFDVNRAGGIVYTAKLVKNFGDTNIGGTNDHGVWIAPAGGVPILAARKGDPFENQPGDIRNISLILIDGVTNAVGGTGTNPKVINDSGIAIIKVVSDLRGGGAFIVGGSN